MWVVGTVKIRSYEKGLVFKDREFKGVLGEGRHWFVDPLNKMKVQVVSQRAPWLEHAELDAIVKSKALGDAATVIDLKDHQRALVWIDGRFDRILGAGLYVVWNSVKKITVDVVDADTDLFEHKESNVITRSNGSAQFLDIFEIEEGHKGVLYRNGTRVRRLDPGRYASWKNIAKVKVHFRDVREKVLDVSGQELMTSDKVTLRMNVVAAYRINDLEKVLDTVSDVEQSLYREVQLVLRSEIGTRGLDTLLSDKYSVAQEMEAKIRERAALMGVELLSLGIKDIILPGDMKALLNQVIEARKASEANAITRREETASMRSQLNTAKLMENNSTLMRLRELEVLERVAATSKLNIVTGEKGMAQQLLSLV